MLHFAWSPVGNKFNRVRAEADHLIAHDYGLFAMPKNRMISEQEYWSLVGVEPPKKSGSS